MVWLGIHDARLAGQVRRECQSEQLQKTLKEIERQRDAGRRAVEDAEKQAAVDNAEIAKLNRDIGEINESLGAAAADSCVIPADALRKLRDIR